MPKQPEPKKDKPITQRKGNEAFKRKIQDFDEQQKILDGSKSQGLVTLYDVGRLAKAQRATS